MTTVAASDGDELVINGAKTWITNARRSGLIALLCKTDPRATPAHTGISIVLVEHGDGLTVSRDLPKLGYKGVESCELSFADYRIAATAILGGEHGQGLRADDEGAGRRLLPGGGACPRRLGDGGAGGRPGVRPAARELRQALPWMGGSMSYFNWDPNWWMMFFGKNDGMQ